MSGGTTALIIAFGFLLVFPLFWMAIVWLLSGLSGWRTLARHYGYSGALPRTQHQYQYLSMGYNRIFMMRYNLIANISVDESYLYLSVMRIFSIGNKPLRIPLADLDVSDVNMSFLKSKCVRAARATNIRIHLSTRLVKKLEAGQMALQT